jgi:hypothetical protein
LRTPEYQRNFGAREWLDRAIHAAPKLAAMADESVPLYQQQGTFTLAGGWDAAFH